MSDIVPLLLLLGSLQGLILVVVLITIKSESQLANRILAAIILLFSFHILFHTVFHTDQNLNITVLDSMGDHLHTYFEPLHLFYGFAFLFGPLFYFYYKAVVLKKFRFKKTDIVHFLPAILCLLAVIFMFFTSPAAGEQNKTSMANIEKMFVWVSWLIFIQAFSYILTVTYSFYKERHVKLTHSASPVSNWLVIFMICFGLIWLVAIFVQIKATGNDAWNYVWLLASVLIYTTGYMGLYRPRLFTNIPYQRSNSGKYEKSSLTDANAQEYLEKLRQLMRQEKPFLNPDLTLPKLAQRLGISHHHLSQIINRNLNQNFFEFLSSYRIKEAQEQMLDPLNERFNIATIAMNVGFNSISSFNTAFKKQTGITPSQFIEQQKSHR